MSRAASLIESCNHFIREHLLLDPGQPDWQELDSLADAIASLEYYLERLNDDPALSHCSISPKAWRHSVSSPANSTCQYSRKC